MAVSALVLCGGMGSRLATVVNDVPKPMALVRGVPFLDILISWLEQQEVVNEVILAAGHLGDIIDQHYQAQRRFSLSVKTVIEIERLGTGGGIVNGLKHVSNDECIVLNGDSFIDVDLTQVVEQHRSSMSDITVVGTVVADANRFGQVVLANDNKIQAFSEKKEAHSSGHISCGIYVMKKSFANEVFKEKRFSLENWFQDEVSNHNIRFFMSNSDFIDMGTPESYSAVQSFFNVAERVAVKQKK